MSVILRGFVPRAILVLCLALAFAPEMNAQQTGRLLVRVSDVRGPVEGAQVISGAVGSLTDVRGEATLTLPVGEVEIRVGRIGYGERTVAAQVVAGSTAELAITLTEEAIETEGIVVTSTRTDRRIEDEPLRVEVIAREEVEEKLMMTPGDISMLLNETAGLRVQPTAPALGGASVRIQGLLGRYTQILSDGLPLYGGQTGALGPLQIPPLDLGQVEVIKGVASALYGASALGGVVNLISRRPPAETEREILLNQTALGGTDGVLWSSDRLGERWGYNLLASAHRQAKADVDDDGWADLPSFRRAVVRPRLFWNDGRGGTALITVGGMIETREGGTMPGGLTPAGTSFREALETKRMDGGTVARFVIGQAAVLSVRGSGAISLHDHRLGETTEEDLHGTGFAEVAISASEGAHAFVAGAAFQADHYGAKSLSGFDYTFHVPGLFVQEEYAPSDWFTASASARLDHHGEYGSFVNPRISVLLRPTEALNVRASAGTGYFAPTPWTEETEAIGLSRLVPLSGIEAERARSASLDAGLRVGDWELNATAFGSAIRRPVRLRELAGDPSRDELYNSGGDVRTWGSELLARFHREELHVTATHVYLRSTESTPDETGRREVPLTPRHTAGLVGAWEQEGRSRIGVELYFTGRQTLEENPYRTVSKPYAIAGFLVERRFGPARIFLNAENVLDTRQTRSDRLVLPARSLDGRWVTDVWGPIDGRSFNLGVRWELARAPSPP